MNTNNLEASEPIMPAKESPVATGMNNLRVESADAAREWLSLEHLALGSERVGGMVVQSAPMRKVLKAISRFSPHKATVLVQGESGTGKELVARALHTQGSATGGPFVNFNCSNHLPSRSSSVTCSALSPMPAKCPRGFARLFPVGERRNLVPGRNRRASAAVTAQVAARGTRGLLVP